MYKPQEVEAFIAELQTTFDIEDEGEALWYLVAKKTLAYLPIVNPRQAAELTEILEQAPNFPYDEVIAALKAKSSQLSDD